MEQIFKNGPSKTCGRQPLKNLKEYGLFKQSFKGCLPQILLDPFLNTLSLKCTAIVLIENIVLEKFKT